MLIIAFIIFINFYSQINKYLLKNIFKRYFRETCIKINKFSIFIKIIIFL